MGDVAEPVPPSPDPQPEPQLFAPRRYDGSGRRQRGGGSGDGALGSRADPPRRRPRHPALPGRCGLVRDGLTAPWLSGLRALASPRVRRLSAPAGRGRAAEPVQRPRTGDPRAAPPGLPRRLLLAAGTGAPLRGPARQRQEPHRSGRGGGLVRPGAGQPRRLCAHRRAAAERLVRRARHRALRQLPPGRAAGRLPGAGPAAGRDVHRRARQGAGPRHLCAVHPGRRGLQDPGSPARRLLRAVRRAAGRCGRRAGARSGRRLAGRGAAVRAQRRRRLHVRLPGDAAGRPRRLCAAAGRAAHRATGGLRRPRRAARPPLGAALRVLPARGAVLGRAALRRERAGRDPRRPLPAGRAALPALRRGAGLSARSAARQSVRDATHGARHRDPAGHARPPHHRPADPAGEGARDPARRHRRLAPRPAGPGRDVRRGRGRAAGLRPRLPLVPGGRARRLAGSQVRGRHLLLRGPGGRRRPAEGRGGGAPAGCGPFRLHPLDRSPERDDGPGRRRPPGLAGLRAARRWLSGRRRPHGLRRAAERARAPRRRPRLARRPACRLRHRSAPPRRAGGAEGPAKAPPHARHARAAGRRPPPAAQPTQGEVQ